MDAGHSSEYISAHWGALRAGHSVKILPSTSIDSVETFRGMLIQEQPSVILVSPNHPTYVTDSNSYIPKKDILNMALPEVLQSSDSDSIGQPITNTSLPDLRFIIQTGFYNLPGFVKFRDMLVYRSNKYNTFSKVPETPIGQSFTSNLIKQIGNVQDSMVYNLLDLQDPNSVQSLLECLNLAQENELFTNVVPSYNLDELLLEKTFLQDLSQNHNSVVVGTSESLNKVKEALGSDLVKYFNVASQ